MTASGNYRHLHAADGHDAQHHDPCQVPGLPPGRPLAVWRQSASEIIRGADDVRFCNTDSATALTVCFSTVSEGPPGEGPAKLSAAKKDDRAAFQASIPTLLDSSKLGESHQPNQCQKPKMPGEQKHNKICSLHSLDPKLDSLRQLKPSHTASKQSFKRHAAAGAGEGYPCMMLCYQCTALLEFMTSSFLPWTPNSLTIRPPPSG